jgi:DNA-binding IclR family transcriptional regulator
VLLFGSSTLLLLRTLVGHGYATRDTDGHYAATPGPPRGHLVARLLDAAVPVMTELCATLRETVLLGVPSAGRVRVVAKEVSPQELRYDADLTHLRPCYCTAMGRVLLASLPPDQRRRALAASPLRAYTPHTLTDPDALEQVLRQAREAGYATVEEQFVQGCSGVAAPITDRAGRVVAALDVASVVPRFAMTRDRLVAGAVTAAAEISRGLL